MRVVTVAQQMAPLVPAALVTVEQHRVEAVRAVASMQPTRQLQAATAEPRSITKTRLLRAALPVLTQARTGCGSTAQCCRQHRDEAQEAADRLPQRHRGLAVSVGPAEAEAEAAALARTGNKVARAVTAERGS